MHFGRTDELDGTATDLPPEPVRTERFLALNWQGRGRILAGAPVWAGKELVGPLYPVGTPPRKFLELYAQRYQTVEVNSTFYQQLPPSRMAAWAAQTPREFRFCPKVFRGITEKLASPDLARLTKEYFASVAGFGSRLGFIFATLPEYFQPTQLPLLARFLKLIPQDFKVGVEFRHPAFFREHALIDEAIDMLYRAGVATVISDTTGRRDALHLSLTQPRVMVRILGNSGHPSDGARLNAWARKAKAWGKAGLDEVYLIVHQADEALIPETTDQLVALLEGRPLSALQVRGLFDAPTSPRPNHATS